MIRIILLEILIRTLKWFSFTEDDKYSIKPIGVLYHNVLMVISHIITLSLIFYNIVGC